MEELEKNETSTQAEENTVSLASAQALADALAKIEAYTPTTWVDNSSPDIDAEHLNKPEQAIKRVTDALNSAVDVIKDLQSQVTKNAGDISTVNNNLSKKLFVKIGDTSNGNHSQIDQIADFYGITWVNYNYNSTFGGQWCFIDSTIIDNSGPYAMQRIMSCENAAVLATRYCTKGTWGAWNVGVTKSEIKVTNYFDRIKPDSAYINGYNNNEQCAKLIEISDNIKIVNINLAVKTKALNKIEAQIIELPAQIRPQKNVVFTAYANKEPAFAYYSSGKIMFIYNKALTENAEIDIIASYLI